MKKEKTLNSKLIKKVAGIASVFALAAVSSFAYTTPTSYVSLDVNPSIEYSLNMFDKVLTVKAVNEDGQEIVANLEVKNLEISEAVQKTIDKLLQEGYITDDENAGIVIAISNDNEEKSEELATELEQETQEYIDEVDDSEETAAVKVEVEAVGKARVEEAKTLGVTPGKLNLVEKLIASYGDTKVKADYSEDELKDMLNMSVKEINKTIKENRKSLLPIEAVNEETTLETEATDTEETNATVEDAVTTDVESQNKEKAVKEKEKVNQIKENNLNKENKGKSSNANNLGQNTVEDDDSVVKTNNSKSENTKK
jgi:biotin operon repressor